MLIRAALTAILVLVSASAHAAKVCAWIVETNEPEDERLLTLWLQSDAEIDFLYKIGGDGIVTGMGKSNSPSSGTFALHPGQSDSPWKYGATLNDGGRIDVTVELHKTPADIFSDAPTPLLARFVFRRNVPESEKQPPKTFAQKQCVTVKT